MIEHQAFLSLWVITYGIALSTQIHFHRYCFQVTTTFGGIDYFLLYAKHILPKCMFCQSIVSPSMISLLQILFVILLPPTILFLPRLYGFILPLASLPSGICGFIHTHTLRFILPGCIRFESAHRSHRLCPPIGKSGVCVLSARVGRS